MDREEFRFKVIGRMVISLPASMGIKYQWFILS